MYFPCLSEGEEANRVSLQSYDAESEALYGQGTRHQQETQNRDSETQNQESECQRCPMMPFFTPSFQDSFDVITSHRCFTN